MSNYNSKHNADARERRHHVIGARRFNRETNYIETLSTKDMALPKERKIITKHEYPPIPWRSFDWVAFREGNEENGPFYWGKTEADAISELKEYEVEE